MHLGKEEFITHIWCHTHAKPARANDEHWTAAVRSVLCYQFEIYAGNHVKFIVASFDIAFLFTSSRAIMTPLIHTQNIFSILFSRILHPVCFAPQQRALNHRVKENRSGISFIFMKNFSFFSPALLLTPFESCFCCCSARDEKMRVKGGGGGIKATPKREKNLKNTTSYKYQATLIPPVSGEKRKNISLKWARKSERWNTRRRRSAKNCFDDAQEKKNPISFFFLLVARFFPLHFPHSYE